MKWSKIVLATSAFALTIGAVFAANSQKKLQGGITYWTNAAHDGTPLGYQDKVNNTSCTIVEGQRYYTSSSAHKWTASFDFKCYTFGPTD